jgi:hypothetical protein
VLDHQSEAEEIEIVLAAPSAGARTLDDAARRALARSAVAIARATRSDPRVRRGASVRAAIAIAEIAEALAAGGTPLGAAVEEAAAIALPTRIELARDFGAESEAALDATQVVAEIAKAAAAPIADPGKKVPRQPSA